jgi:hypothetical protein
MAGKDGLGRPCLDLAQRDQAPFEDHLHRVARGFKKPEEVREEGDDNHRYARKVEQHDGEQELDPARGIGER